MGAKIVEFDNHSEAIFDIYVAKPGLDEPPYEYIAGGGGNLMLDPSVTKVTRVTIRTEASIGVLVGEAERREGTYGPWFVARLPGRGFTDATVSLFVERDDRTIEPVHIAAPYVAHVLMGQAKDEPSLLMTGCAGDTWNPDTPYYWTDCQTYTEVSWRGGCDGGECGVGFAGATLGCSSGTSQSNGEWFCPPGSTANGFASYTGRKKVTYLSGQGDATVFSGCYSPPGSDYYQSTFRIREHVLETGTSYPSVTDLSVDLSQASYWMSCSDGGVYVHQTLYRCETHMIFVQGTNCSGTDMWYDESVGLVINGDYGYKAFSHLHIAAGVNGASLCKGDNCTGSSQAGAFMTAQSHLLGLETYFYPVLPILEG